MQSSETSVIKPAAITGVDFFVQEQNDVFVANRKPFLVTTMLAAQRSVATDIRILDFLASGLMDKEIASIMFLSCRTIENRIDRMKDTLQAKTMPHLVAIALRKKIII